MNTHRNFLFGLAILSFFSSQDIPTCLKQRLCKGEVVYIPDNITEYLRSFGRYHSYDRYRSCN